MNGKVVDDEPFVLTATKDYCLVLIGSKLLCPFFYERIQLAVAELNIATTNCYLFRIIMFYIIN